MAGDPTPALTGRRRTRPTSPGCRNPWQPKPGRAPLTAAQAAVQTNRATSVHGRGDPVGRALVSDVPDQLPRSRADAAGPWGGGRPHNPLPLDPGLCPGAGEADPAAPTPEQRLVAGR